MTKGQASYSAANFDEFKNRLMGIEKPASEAPKQEPAKRQPRPKKEKPAEPKPQAAAEESKQVEPSNEESK